MSKNNWLPLLILLLGVGSCKKILDTKPDDFVSPENYYNTEKDLNAALTGVYDVLGAGSMWGNTLHVDWAFGSDEGYFAQSFLQAGLLVYNYDPANAQVLQVWRNLYFGINRANLLLENINKATGIDSAQREAIRGEALFLRAYYYFLLVSNWGDVPLKLQSTVSVTDVALTRTPASEVYAQIIKDMTTAESLVKTATSLGAGGRVSKTTVEGMLARVCLYMAGNPLNDATKYAEALSWASKVKASGEHTLNPDFKQVFINYIRDIYDVKESMWEVEFYGNGLNDAYQEFGNVGSFLGIQCTDVNIGYAYTIIIGVERLFKAFQGQDLRRDWALAPYKWIGIPGVKTATSATAFYDRNCGKFRRDVLDASVRKNNNNTSTNWPLLRYADVLLMLAEAENEVNGPTTVAYDAINEVRKRAYGSDQRVATITITNQGAGYTTPPIISIAPGTGTAAANNVATATATITAGRVTGITIASPGAFYSAAPLITITGGGGTGATATATITPINDANLTPGLSKVDFRTAVQQERYRELCFEGNRKYDLNRWNIFLPTMKAVELEFATAPSTNRFGAVAFRNIQQRHLLLPIPTADLSVNKSLTQNPGW